MPLQTEHADRKRDLLPFLNLALRIYRDDPDWVAPMRIVRGTRLALERRSNDRFTVLMVRREGRVEGRCVVFRDAHHDRHKDEKVCFFGYFEASDDEVGRALLDAAEHQAKAWDAEILRGPRGMTRIDERGVLVEGHHMAPMMAGHAPPRYAALFETLGFTKHHDALAYEIELNDPDGTQRDLPEKLAKKADEVDIPGLVVRGLKWSSVLSDLDAAHTVMVDAFRDVPDNTPLPKGIFRALGVPLLAVTHPEMLQLALVNGQPAGFALCFPEINEALIYARGGLGPPGLVRIVRGRTKIRTATFKLLGILPEHRGSGLHALLIRQAIAGIRVAGYNRLEASLIDERNKPMRTVVEGAGMTVYRRYRVYERVL